MSHISRVGVSLRRTYVVKIAAQFLVAVVVCIAAAEAGVDSADDVCAPNADPCVIREVISVDDGAVLDFGDRVVRVAPGGQIDVGAGAAALRCGAFAAETGTDVALNVRGLDPAGALIGGILSIEAVGSCELEPTQRCLANRECDFGECTAKTCTLDRARLCSDDAQCDLGECTSTFCSRGFFRACSDDASCSVGPCNLTTRRCTNSTDVVCFSNAQCEFGTCVTGDTFCSADGTGPCDDDSDCKLGMCDVDVCDQPQGDVYSTCSSNGDCDAGACVTGGAATIHIGGRVRGDAEYPAHVGLKAAGDVDIVESIQLSVNDERADGGRLDVVSGTGSVRVAAKIVARGGAESQGGEINVSAEQEVHIEDLLDVTGGNFDGGLIELRAARDLILSDTLLLSAARDGGFGGDLTAVAGRDLVVDESVRVIANGHEPGGSGAFDHLFTAGRDLTVAPGATFACEGAAPDGWGGTISFEAGRNASFAGKASVAAVGAESGPGEIYFDVGNELVLTPESELLLTGGPDGPGQVFMEAGGDLTLSGMIDTRVAAGGRASHVAVEAGGDLLVAGDVLLSGGPDPFSPGEVQLEGCAVELVAGAHVDNVVPGAINILTGHESIKIGSGSALVAGPGGSNLLRYRDGTAAPSVSGFVAPTQQNEVDATLSSCPVCGNLVLERRESCDDGNIVAGDGCNEACQDEGCIAATVGYPDVALCSDGDPCTIDVCDAATHTCSSAHVCDDGNGCTVDSCDPLLGCSNVAEPLPPDVCSTGGAATVDLKGNGLPARNRLRWRVGDGTAASGATPGFPDTDTTYSLCVYDVARSSPALVASIDVGPGASWRSVGASAWEYFDARAASDGVRRLKVGAADGQSPAAFVVGRGVALPLPLAKSAQSYFEVDPALIVQLINSDGLCLSTEFSSAAVTHNGGRRFKARMR